MMISKKSPGYVLVLVLTFTALLSLTLSYFSSWMLSNYQSERALDQKSKALISMHDAEVNALYWLLTYPTSSRGLEFNAERQPGNKWKVVRSNEAEEDARQYIPLNSAIYRFGQVYLGIQDESGLINLNKLTEAGIKRVLGILEVDKDERKELAAKMKDYVEYDGNETRKRVGGASYQDYIQAVRIPPAGDAIRTPFEMKMVMDFEKQEVLWKKNKIVRFVTTYAGPPVNVNTMPIPGFEFIPSMTKEIIESIRQKRASNQPYFESIKDFEKDTGIKLGVNSKSFSVVPGKVQRLYIENNQYGIAEMISVTLHPDSPDGPWTINFRVPVAPMLNIPKEKHENYEAEILKIPPFPDPYTFLGGS